jgi:hypothetical protein
MNINYAHEGFFQRHFRFLTRNDSSIQRSMGLINAVKSLYVMNQCDPYLLHT